MQTEYLIILVCILLLYVKFSNNTTQPPLLYNNGNVQIKEESKLTITDNENILEKIPKHTLPFYKNIAMSENISIQDLSRVVHHIINEMNKVSGNCFHLVKIMSVKMNSLSRFKAVTLTLQVYNQIQNHTMLIEVVAYYHETEQDKLKTELNKLDNQRSKLINEINVKMVDTTQNHPEAANLQGKTSQVNNKISDTKIKLKASKHEETEIKIHSMKSVTPMQTDDKWSPNQAIQFEKPLDTDWTKETTLFKPQIFDNTFTQCGGHNEQANVDAKYELIVQ